MPHNKYLWPISRQVHERALRTELVMARLGIDAATVARQHNGEALAKIRRTCFDCNSSGPCLRWLQSDHPEDPEPGFCPNLETFHEFRHVGQKYKEGE